MTSTSKYIFIGLAFLTLAALLRFWIAPLFEVLPAGYANEMQLAVNDQFRDSPTGEWQVNTLSSQRVDQAITNTEEISIIEGALHVYYADGSVNFESISLYGVDRRSRANHPGYGTVEHSGQYLFPTHVEQKTYPLWDPMFIGLRQATFDHVDNFEGLQVYVFKFSATGLDETAGYSYLPDVPERYLAHTDGEGTLWIEPLSGVMVNYADQGESYFADPASGTRLTDGEFHQWSQTYTPETRLAQLALAHTARLRMLALEVWLPGSLLLVGLLFVGLFLFQRKKNIQ